jgi:peptidoglycan/xylan/chitin deacetylase (PgdA/CDA1 family)
VTGEGSDNRFTFAKYSELFESIRADGYRAITMREYFTGAFDPKEPLLVSRVDVDVKIDRLPRLRAIYRALDLHATFFLRFHAPTYNLLSFHNVSIVKDLIDDGHEVGIHTELSDAEGFCSIDGAALLTREIELLQTLTGVQVHGTASHGDMTGYNNLDYWKSHRAQEFGLSYEAYDAPLWKHCRYVSDSEWVRWKAYENGNLISGDRRSPAEHAKDKPRVLHVLTHPESWYDRYIYE